MCLESWRSSRRAADVYYIHQGRKRISEREREQLTIILLNPTHGMTSTLFPLGTNTHIEQLTNCSRSRCFLSPRVRFGVSWHSLHGFHGSATDDETTTSQAASP